MGRFIEETRRVVWKEQLLKEKRRYLVGVIGRGKKKSSLRL